MDPETIDKGRELQEILMLFKETATSPLSGSILQTPLHKIVLKQTKNKKS
jgi:hypothetical protein